MKDKEEAEKETTERRSALNDWLLEYSRRFGSLNKYR